LFVIEHRSSDSVFIERTWSSESEPAPFFLSVAASRWQMVVTNQEGVSRLAVRGPETHATVTAIPADAEFFGIVFSLGTFVPGLPLVDLVDRAVTLPAPSRKSVGFGGSQWELPTIANADTFVERLVAHGVIARDPFAAEWTTTDPVGVSTRTVQRRVARATGLTRRTIRQIARAELAVEALTAGRSPLDTALMLGYADQAHLTRSLQRFVGQTPARVAESFKTAAVVDA
jgi:AraC-like DNA-binding protein